MTERQHVIVVGAGVAGLVLARELAIADLRVTVLEAGERPGGQLASVALAGVEVDAGAESFAVRGGTVAALAAELGLEVAAPLDAPAWLVRAADDAHPLPPASLLGIPSSPMLREVIDLIGMRAAFRAQLDAVIPMLRPAKYRSLGDLVRRRMGRTVLERLVAPVVRGVYSTTPDELPLEVASPRLPAELARGGTLATAVAAIRAASPAGSQIAGIRGGMHRLATTLVARAERVGVEIRTNAPVASADPDGVRLTDGERLTGRVVIAAPGVASAPIREREITLVLAAVDSAALDAVPRGTGALVAAGASGIAARALTHSSAKWPWLGEGLPPHRHLVRLSYDETPADPAVMAAADLRAITGAADAVVVDLQLRRWRRTPQAEAPPEGMWAVGEAASRTGLAAIVGHARETAADLISASTTMGMDA